MSLHVPVLSAAPVRAPHRGWGLPGGSGRGLGLGAAAAPGEPETKAGSGFSDAAAFVMRSVSGDVVETTFMCALKFKKSSDKRVCYQLQEPRGSVSPGCRWESEAGRANPGRDPTSSFISVCPKNHC